MKALICLLVTGCFLCTGIAQSRVSFCAQNYAGLLIGESKVSGAVQTVNGLRYKTWIGGLGLGVDGYLYASIPLFLSIRKDLRPGPSTFYFSLDGGRDIPAYQRGSDPSRYISSKFHASWYGAAGAGYQLGFKNSRTALLFRVGYSYKALIEKRELDSAPCVDPPCQLTKETYDYHLRCFNLFFGFQF